MSSAATVGTGTWPPLHLTQVPEEDIERGDGDAVIDVIETLCITTKDGFATQAGDSIELRDWQRNLIRHLFARRPDGRRRHRTALIGMPRKNGKSALSSGLALDGLLFDGKGAEVYSAAAEKEQARIVFGETKRIIEANPELSGHCNTLRDVIEVPSTNSIYRCLSAESYSKEGLNISRCLYDELHAQPNDDLWNVLTLASAARRNPLMIAVTTAGVMSDSTGRDSVCYRLFKYGVDIAEGRAEDPSFFMAWWGAPRGADHLDPEVWRAANPGYGDILDPEDFESAVKRTPEGEFRALDAKTEILTSIGWKTMGTVAVGDTVYSAAGKPTLVTGVSEFFTERDCYEVCLEDGRSLVADLDHQWRIEEYNPNNQSRCTKIVSTQYLVDNPSVCVDKGRYPRKLELGIDPTIKYIKNSSVLDIPEQSLGIDPYILGYWLGDGGKHHPTLVCSREDATAFLTEVERAGYFYTIKDEGSLVRFYLSCCPIRRGGGERDTLRKRLISYELLENKHIPDSYLLSSESQRLALLQGLMDSDGTIGALAGRPRFVNTNKNLAEGVLFLARSMGWKATLGINYNSYGPVYKVSWSSFSDEKSPFRLRRKCNRLPRKPKNPTRSKRSRIISITKVESRVLRCIEVDDPSHVFLAGKGLFPTHNTKRLNQWVAAAEVWFPAGVFPAAKNPDRALKKGEELVLGVDASFDEDATVIAAATVGAETFVDIVGAWERPEDDENWKVPIAEVEDKIREACKRYKVRAVVFDPYGWARTMEALASERLPIEDFPQSNERMVPATSRFFSGITEGNIKHSGNEILVRHVANAHTKFTPRGSKIVKDQKSSARKIDAAVASVIAVSRAQEFRPRKASVLSLAEVLAKDEKDRREKAERGES